jgi:hypothetical protein
VKHVATSAMLAGAIFCAGSAQAQLPAAFTKACAERTTIANWCPTQVKSEGWKLKYETENPRDLADAYWRYEVWVRDQSAVLCVLVGGRSGILINHCEELSEVSQ